MQIVFNSPLKEALQRALTILIGTVDNLCLVCAEYKETESSQYTSFEGLQIAKNLADDQDKFVILMSFLDEEKLFSSRPDMAGLLSLKNVAFLSLPLQLNEIIETYRILEKGEKKENKLAALAFKSKMLDRTVSILCHDLYHAERGGDEDMKQWLERAKQAGFTGTPEEIRENVRIWKRTTAGRFEGEQIEGIFVDFQGTLVVNGQLNEKVLSLIEKLKGVKNEKSVCVISDSDLSDVSKELIRLGISYPVMSKFELKGAALEIVIDDLSQVEFHKEYGIIPMSFFQAE